MAEYKILYNIKTHEWVCTEHVKDIDFYGYGQTPEDALAAIVNTHKDYEESLWAK